MRKKHDEEIREYYTADLHEAVAISLSTKPIRLEFKGDRFVFVFKGSESEQIANKYWSCELKGNIRQYVDVLRSTKDWLFSKKREMTNK